MLILLFTYVLARITIREKKYENTRTNQAA